MIFESANGLSGQLFSVGQCDGSDLDYFCRLGKQAILGDGILLAGSYPDGQKLHVTNWPQLGRMLGLNWVIRKILRSRQPSGCIWEGWNAQIGVW